MSEGRVAARINLPGIAVFLLIFLIWEAAIRFGLVTFEYLPGPSAIVSGAVDLLKDGILVEDTLHTLFSVAIGWMIAMALGVSIGLVLGFSRFARTYSLATFEMLRPMPGIAFAPLGLLLFGFSLETELVVMVLPAIWPVMINTMGGVMSVQPRLIDVGRTFRLSRGQIVRRLLLPAALPTIMVGARISLGLALILAVVAEMVGNPEGLGYGIVREQQALHPDYMFAYIGVVGLLGLGLNAGVVALTAMAWPSVVALRSQA